MLTFYEHFVGKPPPSDAGCDMLSVLKYWRSTGLDAHKVQGFAALDLKNQGQAENAVFLTGAIYIGVALPNFAVTGDMLTTPWVVPAGGPVGDAAPNPDNGHCIPAVAYDAAGLTVVTWGETKSMSWEFYDAYADEAFAVVSADFIDAKTQTHPLGSTWPPCSRIWRNSECSKYVSSGPIRPSANPEAGCLASVARRIPGGSREAAFAERRDLPAEQYARLQEHHPQISPRSSSSHRVPIRHRGKGGFRPMATSDSGGRSTPGRRQPLTKVIYPVAKTESDGFASPAW